MSAPTIDPALMAEHAAIGALLLTVDELRHEALKVMQGSDFVDLRCRFIVDVVRTMDAEGVPVDAITVHSFVEQRGLLTDRQLRGSLALWLSERCSDVPVPASLPWYARQVAEQATRRKILESGERITASSTRCSRCAPVGHRSRDGSTGNAFDAAAGGERECLTTRPHSPKSLCRPSRRPRSEQLFPSPTGHVEHE